MIEAFVIFALMILTNFVWAITIRSITNDKVLMGGISAAVLVVLNGFATISYVHKPIMIVPAALGAFVGILLSSKFKK